MILYSMSIMVVLHKIEKAPKILGCLFAADSFFSFLYVMRRED